MLDKALAVKTLASCEKMLGEWAEVAKLCAELEDRAGRDFAMTVCDPLLDLRAILTESIPTATPAAA